MSNVDHAAMVDGDILLFTLPQSAYIYRKSRTAHAPSNFLKVGVRLLETGEDAAIGDRNFRSRLYTQSMHIDIIIGHCFNPIVIYSGIFIITQELRSSFRSES